MKCCCVLSLLCSWKKQTKTNIVLVCRHSDKDQEQNSIRAHVKHRDTELHIMNIDRHPSFQSTGHKPQSSSNMCWMPFKQEPNLRSLQAAKAALTTSKPKTQRHLKWPCSDRPRRRRHGGWEQAKHSLMKSTALGRLKVLRYQTRHFLNHVPQRL